MTESRMEDHDIITRCKSGDTEAFGMIVRKYQERILAISWSILRNREEARDVTQEAFLQAFTHLGHFEPAGSFKNWLYAIATRKCLDRKRKEKSFLKYFNRTKAEGDDILAHNPGPHDWEQQEILNPAFAKLNSKERISFFLKVKEGYAAAEIAQIFGCAESTVRVYLFNARRKLQRYLGDKDRV